MDRERGPSEVSTGDPRSAGLRYVRVFARRLAGVHFRSSGSLLTVAAMITGGEAGSRTGDREVGRQETRERDGVGVGETGEEDTDRAVDVDSVFKNKNKNAKKQRTSIFSSSHKTLSRRNHKT